MVETRFITAQARPAGSFEIVCVERMHTGELREMPEEECRNQLNCIVCDQNDNCEAKPINECDKVIGYTPKDHERILSWGRRNCR